MANRTDSTTVKGILKTALSDAVIETHVTIANSIVNDNLLSSGLSSTTLTHIETYLTAHLIAIGKERQAMEEEIGDVSIKYQGTFKQFLEMTTYGQTAMMLDTSGKLGKIGKKRFKIKAVKQVKDEYTFNDPA